MNFPESRIKDLLLRRDIPWSSIVHLAEVGSTAHGISVSDAGDDFDATAVRMESFSELVIGHHSRQSMMIRTQPEGIPSRMGDIDLNVYTLRKFAHLAANGNPSILTAIFSESTHVTEIDMDTLGRIVASKKAGYAFLGYMVQQLERWTGERGQKNVKRPDLVEKYGFDTKYAGHVFRLGYQGLEYLNFGRFSVPMVEDEAKFIREVRLGHIPEETALVHAKDLIRILEQAMVSSSLPERVSMEAVNRWVVQQYIDDQGIGGIVYG